ncbi:MAG: hypothetical protein AABY22_05935, partial [Nanoarchaeota archaeon]
KLIKEWKNYNERIFLEFNYQAVDIASLNILYTLKMSHRFLKNSPYFLKTMNDIIEFKAIGCEIPEFLEKWFKLREKETYWYTHPKLNQTKEGFFDSKKNGIKQVYFHDDIHISVANKKLPAYTLYMEDGAEVKCSKEKFFALSEKERIRGVSEEAMVLALERSVIPYNSDPKWAFLKGLEKVSTSITSGWFREFAYANYRKVVDNYNPFYVNQFQQDVEHGIVRKVF